MSALDDFLANQRSLNQWGTTIDVAGQLTGAIGHVQYGMEAAQAAEFQAAQLRQNANNAVAAGQHRAEDVDRQAKILASNALAAAAAGGGGASDPGVVNIIAGVAAEGAYRKAVALYEGQDRARALNLDADTREYAGKKARSDSIVSGAASMFKAGTTAIQGQARDASLYQRFGMGGPKREGDTLQSDQ
jgi:hypothetical protein